MLKLEAVPARIYDDLRQRGHSADEIEQMTAEQAFAEYCQWHGLADWGDHLVQVLDALRSAAEEAEEKAADQLARADVAAVLCDLRDTLAADKAYGAVGRLQSAMHQLGVEY